MGNIGGAELLILIVVIISIWFTVNMLRKVSRIEAWITRHSEARFLATQSTTNMMHRVHSKLWWLPLPFALIAVIALYVISIILVFIASDSTKGVVPLWVESVINFLSNGIAVGFIIVSLLNHFNPGSNRKVKYEFLVAGTSILSLGSFNLVAIFISYAIQIPNQNWMISSTNIDDQVAMWTLIIHVLYLITLQIVFSLWIGSPGKEKKAKPLSSTMRHRYGLVRRAGYVFAFLSISGITQPLLTAYLILRYILGERMSHAPILYLRSFHYIEGPTAFGKIVARTASRYGVLRALTHQTQRPLELHAETRLTERAELVKAPDEDWQNWIEEQLSIAAAIIIDYSIETQGLSWELDRAVKLVDPSKILLLNQKGVVFHAPANIWRLEYEMGPNGEKQAREKLNERLRTVLLTSS